MTPRGAPSPSKWPKTFPPLTAAQEAIRDDFMHHWHEVLPRRYGVVDRFGHQFVADRAPAAFARTLEIGAGLGEHLAYERLDDAQRRGYVALELRESMAAELARRFPGVETLVADCEAPLPFPDGHFDRVIAVHVFEHLRNLPAALRELRRVCSPAGVLQAVIPCEGGLAYSLARRISAQRIFERRYGQPYRWCIEREHVNVPSEILEELAPHFAVVNRAFFPLRVPSIALNLVIGLTLSPI
jgi:SAM-dependent methyltransferase